MRILASTCACLTLAVPVYAVDQVAKLLPSQRITSMIFGYTTGFDGHAALVGATFEKIGANANAGAAYLYEPVDGAWTQTRRFMAPDRHENDFFGTAVAVDSDLIVIGAGNADTDEIADTGAAYVFERTEDVWTRTQKLTATLPVGGLNFGAAAAISGGQLFVSSPAEDHSEVVQPGVIYVFEKDLSGVWQNVDKLTASDFAALDFLGVTLATDGDLLVAGAPFAKRAGLQSAGAAYVYRRVGGVWHEEARLMPDVPQASSEFGVSVAVDNGVIIVGAGYETVDEQSQAGAAYVFEKIDGAWQQTKKLTTPKPAPTDRYGAAVGITNGVALVGAYLNDNAAGDNAGATFVYNHVDSDWAFQGLLVGADTGAGDLFGWSIAAHNGGALISSPFDGLNLGTAYVFSIGGCPADLDQNGAVDIGDLATLLSQYGLTGDLSGDLDNDGDVDISDLAAMLSAYGGDCGI